MFCGLRIVCVCFVGVSVLYGGVVGIRVVMLVGVLRLDAASVGVCG